MVDKYDSKHTGSRTNVQAKFRQRYNITITNVCKGKMWYLYVWLKEHQSLVILKDVWVDAGDTLGTTSLIGTGHRDIFGTFVRTICIKILDTRLTKPNY